MAMQSYLLILALFAVIGHCFSALLASDGSDYEKCERAKAVKNHSFLDLGRCKYYVRAISRNYPQTYEYLKTLDSIIYNVEKNEETNFYNITLKIVTKSQNVTSESYVEQTAQSFPRLVAFKKNQYALVYGCSPAPYRTPYSTVDRTLFSTEVNTNVKAALRYDRRKHMSKSLIKLPLKHVHLIDN